MGLGHYTFEDALKNSIERVSWLACLVRLSQALQAQRGLHDAQRASTYRRRLLVIVGIPSTVDEWPWCTLGATGGGLDWCRVRAVAIISAFASGYTAMGTGSAYREAGRLGYVTEAA